jgi:tripartite-type tricarboxylate transporter receptor subunit TctC
MKRIHWLARALVYGLAAWSSASFPAQRTAAGDAERYPVRPIRVVSTFAAGGGGTIVARMIGQKISESWGVPWVVDSRPGASGIIGTELVARSQQDGYTLLWAFANFTTNPGFYLKLPFDPVRDFAPVTTVVTVPSALAVAPGLGVITVPELIALAKAQPGKIRFGSSGTGTPPHLAGELLKAMTGINIMHVPYKGISPAMIAQLSGEVQLNFPTLISGGQYFRSGQLRALGVTSLTRALSMPEVPTLDESGLPGFEAVVWYGMLAPAGTPSRIIDKIQREVARVVAIPEVREKLLAQGTDPVATRPEEFARQIRVEIDKWGKLVKQLGLKLEP